MASDVEVQLINLRLTIMYPLERPQLPALARRASGAAPFTTRMVYSTKTGDAVAFRVFQRGDLRTGDSINGPAAIEEAGTTTIIDVADTLSVEDHGCLMIEVSHEA
jgi:N-methylhydantoinase A/oxoprolinase/acetone carboxylase beta subunit